MGGLCVVGIVVLLAGAAASFIGYFWRRSDRHWCLTVVAHGMGLLGLVAAVVLIVGHFSLLTGTDSPVVNGLPWLVVAAAVLGVGYALWLRGSRPEIYRGLAADAPTRAEAEVAPPAGAGPVPAPVESELA